MKAIETRYKSCLFRSRLEARWAVFFDSMGIAWQYEIEGYDLGDAGWYLPDFYLPDIDIWAEVKPHQLNKKERSKAFALSSFTGKPLIELGYIPEPSEYSICSLRTYVGSTMEGYEDFFFPVDLINFYCEKTGADKSSATLPDALAWDVKYFKNKHGKSHPRNFIDGMIIHCDFFSHGRKTSLSLSRARSARFEHGAEQW